MRHQRVGDILGHVGPLQDDDDVGDVASEVGVPRAQGVYGSAGLPGELRGRTEQFARHLGTARLGQHGATGGRPGHSAPAALGS